MERFAQLVHKQSMAGGVNAFSRKLLLDCFRFRFR